MARHQRADETYQRAIRSSAELFAARGYLGTSVNELVEHAGLTKNSFYSYFPTKDALALAVVKQADEQWPPLIASFEALRAPAVDTVVALSFELADRCENDPVVRAGIRLCRERDTISPAVPPPLNGWTEQVERLLSPASERELMGLAIPAAVAARVIVTCLVGAQYLATEGELAKRLTEIWTMLLPGLRPTPDPQARIGTAMALRDRARAAQVAAAPTTLWRVVAPA